MTSGFTSGFKRGLRGLGLAGVFACEDQVRLPREVTASSEVFEVGAFESDPTFCPAVVETLERHFAVMRTYLGFDWEPGARIAYRKYRDEQDALAHAGCGDVWACAFGRDVRTPDPLDLHELIHAYLHGVGTPPRLLSEGVAEALACQDTNPSRPALGWREAFSTDYQGSGRRVIYDLGQWFVAHLLRTYGPASFMRLYATLERGASLDEIEKAFGEIYPLPLDALWRDAFSNLDPRLSCLPVWACAGPPARTSGDDELLGAKCDQSDRFRSFSLASPSDVRWTTPAGRLESCDQTAPAPVPHVDDDFTRRGTFVTHLPAGRYFIASRFPMVFQLEAASRRWLGPVCVDLEPFVGGEDLEINLHPRDEAWYLKLRPRIAAPAPALFHSEPEGALAVCAQCADSCQPPGVELWPETTLRLAPTATKVRVTAQ